MKILTLLSGVVTLLVLLTAMICGLWMQSGGTVDSSSLQFHMTSGIAAVVLCGITLLFTIILLARGQKGKKQ
ncbi:hypothetical protein LJC49_03115 [Ruminococcaceae bacterium OttesenSCG-928-I18]|nr:hypothetical protein [Ruminococcaceae bacterium OttesenSCG-928-I18]